jgi:GrpB-like predicted nucleotidyltransferase (UPF0157 family)
MLIVAYRPEWAQDFAAVASPLQQALVDAALRIDQDGSTAVPGLAAKDIIDVQATAHDLTPKLEAALLQASYRRRAEITHDHRPATAAGADRDWEKQ